MNTASKVREALKRGQMTTQQLAQQFGVTQKAMEKTLDLMPDAYVAEWIGPVQDPATLRNRWHRVWAVVDVPKDARKPTNPTERNRP
jgi:hypothetical protein